MKTEVRVKMNEYGDRPEIQVSAGEQFEEEAKLALIFIEKWGMICGEPDGEDSAGRQRGKLSAPADVVERAFTMARLGVEMARARGLTYSLPSFAEVDEIAAQHKAEKEAKKNAKATA